MKRSAILLLLFFPCLLPAQADRQVPVTLESPYNTVYAHLFYLQEDSFEPAIAGRTMYGVSDSARAARLAIQLKQVLDGKGLYVRVNTLPQDSNFVDSLGGNQPTYTLFPEELPEVYVERIDGRWYYSPETVSRIPQLHSQVYPFGTEVLLNLLPKIGQDELLGLQVWQWVGLLALLLLAILIHLLLHWMLKRLVARMSTWKRLGVLYEHPELGRTIARYTSLFLVLRLIKFLLPTLQLSIEASAFAVSVVRILSLIMLLLILWRALDLFIYYIARRSRETESKLDDQLVPIVQGILQTVVLIGGVIQFLRILDVNVTALLAGLSIGAVAIGLAAKDTVANVFGSLMIFLDKPFQIGDWINYSGMDGTVEKVGIRATRVRTFANSLVYIPNGHLTNSTINNYGLRVYRRFKTTISITYDTPPLLIEKFVQGLRDIVLNHPDTRKDYYEIHLNDFGSSSLNILFYIFFSVPSWSDELKGRHEVMLAIIQLAKELGVRFAFPTSTLHIEEMPGQQPLSPNYNRDPQRLDAQLEQFMRDYRQHVERNRKHPYYGKVSSGKSGESGEGE